jgi:hypothetical protein
VGSLTRAPDPPPEIYSGGRIPDGIPTSSPSGVPAKQTKKNPSIVLRQACIPHRDPGDAGAVTGDGFDSVASARQDRSVSRRSAQPFLCPPHHDDDDEKDNEGQQDEDDCEGRVNRGTLAGRATPAAMGPTEFGCLLDCHRVKDICLRQSRRRHREYRGIVTRRPAERNFTGDPVSALHGVGSGPLGLYGLRATASNGPGTT